MSISSIYFKKKKTASMMEELTHYIGEKNFNFNQSFEKNYPKMFGILTSNLVYSKISWKKCYEKSVL